MTVLETDRLTLREVVEDDWTFVYELLNSAGFIANIGDRGVRTEPQARGYIRERIIASYEKHGFGMWLVVQRSDGEAVGLAGLVKRDGLDDPDVGYAFAESAWGRGYAQEVAAAVMRHSRKMLGIEKLAAITTPDNHASMAVLRKVGFTFQEMIELPGIEGESTYFTA